MCRLVAYCGPAIPLENIVIKPSHSLIVQSQVAEEAKLAVNGDGFGLAWYRENESNLPADFSQSPPALYKEVMPAWANPNLLHICKAVRASVFLAHVRASTFGGASYQNCHPFTYGRWSFAHNGQIGGFAQLRRELENMLPDDLFRVRLGITDSELLFLLIVANGLDQDPSSAVERAIGLIRRLHRSKGCHQPLRLTFILSDGQSLFGCRYSSDSQSPTLYLSPELDHGGHALASEPLDGRHANWRMVDDGVLLKFGENRVEQYVISPGNLIAA